MKEMNTLPPLNEELDSLQQQLKNIRKNGIELFEQLRSESSLIRKNRKISQDAKVEMLAANAKRVEEAKKVHLESKEEVASLSKRAETLVHQKYERMLLEEKQNYDRNKKELHQKLTSKSSEVSVMQEKYVVLKKKIATLTNLDEKNNCEKEAQQVKNQLIVLKKDQEKTLKTLKDKYKEQIRSLHEEKYATLRDIYYNRLPFNQSMKFKATNYVDNFNVKSFLLNNGLYLTIILLLFVAVIYYAFSSGAFLFDTTTILLILNQTAPKMFLALGVAGLIVLGGTDLSIGRMVGMGAIFTGMLVTTNGMSSLTFFGNTVDFSYIPLFLRVIMGFALSIIACAFVSSIAGFFTAKFRMHPFISTLSTQLMTFGLLAYITGNNFTGNPDPTVSEIITGNLFGVFPVMIIYAAIGVIVMWFIWNKTKFGKNMFAVGGNAEAASVSGISVFWVTLGVFILAGVYYGIGSSIYGIYTGNVRVQTGQGMEADAIAACVVGGVSFSGGIGKIRGVVIGAILFQAISVILPFIGITDANFQLAIKGFIILSAVALDCAKYLKKK